MLERMKVYIILIESLLKAKDFQFRISIGISFQDMLRDNNWRNPTWADWYDQKPTSMSREQYTTII